jgi:hypothetical protein
MADGEYEAFSFCSRQRRAVVCISGVPSVLFEWMISEFDEDGDCGVTRL